MRVIISLETCQILNSRVRGPYVFSTSNEESMSDARVSNTARRQVLVERPSGHTHHNPVVRVPPSSIGRFVADRFMRSKWFFIGCSLRLESFLERYREKFYR